MIEKEIIYVHTGEIKACNNGVILKSSPLGSCIVIAAYDTGKQVGAMAHFMLPGKAPERKNYLKTRYVIDALQELIDKMNVLGTKEKNIEVCLVGGANIMKRDNDTIAKDNIASVNELLRERNIKIKAESVGGTERRSVSLDVETGCVNYTVGDGAEKILYQFA
ncbi:MAG: hypothetical protein B6D61_06730 [Bacteroidetes bacterium 4484_249]|nr:MAG: hypothetical protein B6D61_06730 [Bacteroidetes bacterium 4484_249]